VANDLHQGNLTMDFRLETWFLIKCGLANNFDRNKLTSFGMSGKLHFATRPGAKDALENVGADAFGATIVIHLRKSGVSWREQSGMEWDGMIKE
jgi:hypothetical protein